MSLALPKDKDLGYKVPAALAKKLERKFSLTSEVCLDNAVCLANYLFALGEVDQARELLESFVFDVRSVEGRRDLWGSVGHGLILLAHIYRTSEPDKASRIIAALDEDDFYTSAMTRYEIFQSDFESHQNIMDYAFTETPKYKCEVIGQEALNFLYFHEMIPVTREPLPADFADTLRGLIDDCYHHLREALAESRVKGRKQSGAKASALSEAKQHADATVLFSGQLSINYGQFYVDEVTPQNEGDYLSVERAFSGQANGLCGGAQKGKLFLVAGPQTGAILIDVLLHSSKPPVDETFEDAVECSMQVPENQTGLCSWAHEETYTLDLPPGSYRVRYSISGMDRDYTEDDEDVDVPISGQRYLLQFWPASAAKDQILKVGSETAAYWHGTLETD